MAIKKKPVLRKPLVKAPLKAKRAQPEDAGAVESDAPAAEAELAPAALPDASDELALQEAPEINYPGEKFKRPRKREPVQNTGTSLDIHDTSKLLIIAWVVIGAVVAMSIYLLLVHADNSEDDVAKRSTAAVAPAKPKPPVAATGKEDARFASNPANKAAVEAYMKFGKWAYTEAIDWDGAKLIDKMNSEVPLGSVDDPDVRELCRLQAENYTLMNSHPLRPYEATAGGTGQTTRGAESPNLAAYKQNENKIQALTSKLRQRYGINLK